MWILLVSVSVLGSAVWASRRERCLIGSVPTHWGFDVNKVSMGVLLFYLVKVYLCMYVKIYVCVNIYVYIYI